MTDDVFIAIDSDALFNKSKAYIGKALRRKFEGELEEYQLWASLALELLGKSALSRKHPCLVVDPSHSDSLFAAAGVQVTTDIKTITAKTLFLRLPTLAKRFDASVGKFCSEIAERRNAELHSADLPFQGMKLEAWEKKYWHACDVILVHMGSSLERWLGADSAEAPRHLLDEATSALNAAVQLRVDAAKKGFQALKKAERERLATTAKHYDVRPLTALFTGRNDHIWDQPCPACDCRAFLIGKQTGEEIVPVTMSDYEPPTWEVVNRDYVAYEFRCPSCELSLTGTQEIEAAGLSYEHEEQEERELQYEPDYGND